MLSQKSIILTRKIPLVSAFLVSLFSIFYHPIFANTSALQKAIEKKLDEAGVPKRQKRIYIKPKKRVFDEKRTNIWVGTTLAEVTKLSWEKANLAKPKQQNVGPVVMGLSREFGFETHHIPYVFLKGRAKPDLVNKLIKEALKS